MQDLALARFTVDRAVAVRSNPDWLTDAWQSSRTRVLIVREGKIPVTDELSIIWVKPESLSFNVVDFPEAVMLLGIDDDHTYVALLGSNEDLSATAWVSVRDTGSQMTTRDVGLAVTATALEAWHLGHIYCQKCAATTQVQNAGWSRNCPNDNSTHFPRTEPAMIVAIEDTSGRILLGRRVGWELSWYSTLAGFIEAGESCEAAVVREVFEESGIVVERESLRYLGSQPWPFPASLMMGYRGLALTEEITADQNEMSDVRWFTREEFVASCANKTLQLPNPTSIAWRLIENWFGETLPRSWSRV